jgi:hypothetical protein
VHDSFPDGHALLILVRDVVIDRRHGVKPIVMDQHVWRYRGTLGGEVVCFCKDEGIWGSRKGWMEMMVNAL